MITFEVFLIGLLITSTLTGLVTEGVKKIFADLKKTFHTNIITGLIALVLSAGIGVCYVIFGEIGFTAQSITSIVILAFASWLCAMVGYDKVAQTIGQFTNIKKG